MDTTPITRWVPKYEKKLEQLILYSSHLRCTHAWAMRS